MTKKTIAKYRGLGMQELEEKEAELRAMLAKERSIKSSGTRPEKPATIGNLRRGIAKCLTIIAEKQKAPKAAVKAAAPKAKKAVKEKGAN